MARKVPAEQRALDERETALIEEQSPYTREGIVVDHNKGVVTDATAWELEGDDD